MMMFSSTIVRRNTTLFAGENANGCHIRWRKHWFDAGTTWRKNWIWERSAMILSNDYSWRCIVSTFQSQNSYSVSYLPKLMSKYIFWIHSNRSCILLLRWHMNFRQGSFWRNRWAAVRSQRDWNGLEPGQPQQDDLNKSFEKTHGKLRWQRENPTILKNVMFHFHFGFRCFRCGWIQKIQHPKLEGQQIMVDKAGPEGDAIHRWFVTNKHQPPPRPKIYRFVKL